ncbi:unnamed protein product [Orchesella dallaii]|uniref:HTH psq-type domain-containing protein n=1 Tax=Orchesella dallaii TaxID=48710 RepID=A0ABP1QBK4_9HEXA
MVRNYKRKTEDSWTKEQLLDALFCIKESKMGINECSKTFGISRATLYRHYQKFTLYGGKDYLEQIRTCGGNPILTRVEELVMEKTIMDLRDQGFTVTSSDIKRICYEYCDTNGIPNQFREDKRMASDDWYYGFVRRHPSLGILKTKRSKTPSDGLSSGVMEDKGKSQPAHKNSESLKTALDEREDMCPGAPVLKKPLKRLIKTEKQKQRGKKARRSLPTVRKEKLTRDGGDQSSLAKTLSDDDKYYADSESMEISEEEDDAKTDVKEESDDDEMKEEYHEENGESEESEEDAAETDVKEESDNDETKEENGVSEESEEEEDDDETDEKESDKDEAKLENGESEESEEDDAETDEKEESENDEDDAIEESGESEESEEEDNLEQNVGSEQKKDDSAEVHIKEEEQKGDSADDGIVLGYDLEQNVLSEQKKDESAEVDIKQKEQEGDSAEDGFVMGYDIVQNEGTEVFVKVYIRK